MVTSLRNLRAWHAFNHFYIKAKRCSVIELEVTLSAYLWYVRMQSWVCVCARSNTHTHIVLSTKHWTETWWMEAIEFVHSLAMIISFLVYIHAGAHWADITCTLHTSECDVLSSKVSYNMIFIERTEWAGSRKIAMHAEWAHACLVLLLCFYNIIYMLMWSCTHASL